MNDETVVDKKVTFSEWAEWVLWSSNGSHTSHPTFGLVINSELMRSGLFKQGRVALSKNEIPGNTTVESFKQHWGADEGKKKFRKSLNYHVGNVRSTDQYWTARNREFRNFAHHMMYKNKTPMRLFVTSSLAEYHDPFLRRLLFKYISVTRSKEEGTSLLTDDKLFYKAVLQCKNVVTHYFSFKQEVWVRELIAKIYEITHYSEAKEFTDGRGAIHGHANAYGNSSTNEAIDAMLVYLATQSVEKYQEKKPMSEEKPT